MSVMDKLKQVEKLAAVPNLALFGVAHDGCESTKGVPLDGQFDGNYWTAKLAGDWLFDDIAGAASNNKPGYWIKFSLSNLANGPALNQRAQVFLWFNYGDMDSPEDDQPAWVESFALEAAISFKDFLINMGVATEESLDSDTYEGLHENFVEAARDLYGKVGNGSVYVKLRRDKNDDKKVYGPELKLGYMSPSDITPPEIPF